MRSLTRAPIVLALAACGAPPVTWSEAVRLDTAAVAAAGPQWRLVLDAHGAAPAARAGAPHAPAAPGSCPGSAVTAREQGRTWHAAWWSARADSSAALMVSRSADDGLTWTPAQPADTNDRGRRGCTRPAPAIAADSATGYVYVAYWQEPAGGGGVWLVHSMDHGAMWHPPLALGFGADPAVADVAAQGDTVAVAYESPNENEGWIDLALSTTAGHITDVTEVAVSGRSVAAHGPRAALRGREVAVAWSADSGRIALVRTGKWRP